MEVTAIILTKDNEKTISDTLHSLDGFSIIVGDLGSTDKTLNICRGVKVIPLKPTNMAECKNQLIDSAKTNWILDIGPNEEIVSGVEKIQTISSSSGPSHYLHVINNGVVSKEIRLFRKGLKFSGRVFPSLEDDGAKVSNVWIRSSMMKNTLVESLTDKWMKDEPLNHEPYYYKAYLALQNGKYKEFLSLADRYLIISPRGIPAFMTKYYMALVELYSEKDAGKSLRSLLPCIALNPCMAEFWCLLGDIYCFSRQYEKAICFYENAMILGERRKKSDLWPMEVAKYTTYPQKMIDKCKETTKKNAIIMPLRNV